MKLIEAEKEISKIELFKYFVEKELTKRMVVVNDRFDFINGIRVGFDEEHLRPVLDLHILEDVDIHFMYVSYIKIRDFCKDKVVDGIMVFVLEELFYNIKRVELLHNKDVIAFENCYKYQKYLDNYEEWLQSIIIKFNKQLLEYIAIADKHLDKNTWEYSYMKHKLCFNFSNPVVIDTYLNNLIYESNRTIETNS
jgi:hypothetical protein